MIRLSRFLYGQEFVLETDHFGFKQVQGGKCKTDAVGTAVSSIKIRIGAIPGQDNVGADCLSRL